MNRKAIAVIIVAIVIVIVIAAATRASALTPERCYEKYDSQITKMFPDAGLSAWSRVDAFHDYADSGCSYVHWGQYQDLETKEWHTAYGMVDPSNPEQVIFFKDTSPPQPDKQRMQQIQQVAIQRGAEGLKQ